MDADFWSEATPTRKRLACKSRSAGGWLQSAPIHLIRNTHSKKKKHFSQLITVSISSS